MHTWKEKLQAAIHETLQHFTASSPIAVTPTIQAVACLDKIINETLPSHPLEKEDNIFIDHCRITYLLKLGHLYQTKQYNAEARALYDIALNIHKNNTEVEPSTHVCILNNLGAIHLKQKEYQQGLNIYDESLNIYYKNSNIPIEYLGNIFLNQGQIYVRLRKYDEALHHFEKAYDIFIHTQDLKIKFATLSTIMTSMIGICALKEDDIELAARFKLMITLFGAKHPEVANTLNTIGIVQIALKKFDHAQINFKKALDMLDNTHPYALQSIRFLTALKDNEQSTQSPMPAAPTKTLSYCAQTKSEQSEVFENKQVKTKASNATNFKTKAQSAYKKQKKP